MNIRRYVRLLESNIFIVSVIFALILSLLAFRKATLYLVFLMVTAVITYYSKLYHLPFDISPLFFFQIVITKYYGFSYTLAYIPFAYIIPKILAGSGFNWESYAFLAVELVANIPVIFLSSLNLEALGMIAIVMLYFGGLCIGLISKPFFVAALDGIANNLGNLTWFLIFSHLISILLG